MWSPPNNIEGGTHTCYDALTMDQGDGPTPHATHKWDGCAGAGGRPNHHTPYNVAPCTHHARMHIDMTVRWMAALLRTIGHTLAPGPRVGVFTGWAILNRRAIPRI